MTLQSHQAVAKELYQMPRLLMRYIFTIIIIVVIVIVLIVIIIVIIIILRPQKS